MAERASDLARRASEPAGMAFEIAFKTAGRLSVPSERALESYERALKPRGGVLGASWEAGEGRGETMKERKEHFPIGGGPIGYRLLQGCSPI